MIAKRRQAPRLSICRRAPLALRLPPWVLGLVLLLACGPAARPPTVPVTPRKPAWFPARSCQEAWAGLGGAAGYDFQRDAKPCPEGNCGYAGYAARVDRRGCYKRWTTLVYMAADNDLAPWAHVNLAEMEATSPEGARTASSEALDVVVQLDTAADSRWLRRLHMFQTGAPLDEAHLKERTERDVRSPIVELLPERDPGDPARELREFLSWGVRAYPAEHYMVVVWGHGEGWGVDQRQPVGGTRGAGFPLWTGGLALDYAQRTYLGIPALHQVLRQVTAEAGQPIDVYAADACLMQSIEVAAELADVARYIVGSTQIEPLGGMPYGEIFARMNAGPQGSAACSGAPDGEACSVAQMLPGVYHDAFRRGLRARLLPGAADKVTLSALRGGEVRRSLLPAMSGLGRALSAYVDQSPESEVALMDLLQEPNRSAVIDALGNTRDLGVFLSDAEEAVNSGARRRGAAQADTALLGAIGQVRQALDRTILSASAGARYPQGRDFRALSVWLTPYQRDYRANRGRYEQSLFYSYDRGSAQAGAWEGWLDRMWR